MPTLDGGGAVAAHASRLEMMSRQCTGLSPAVSSSCVDGGMGLGMGLRLSLGLGLGSGSGCRQLLHHNAASSSAASSTQGCSLE